VPLPAPASPDLGASVGIPALTAHRCLTVHEDGPTRLSPGALAGRTVLVHGGAGAVGNAAIQLARWAGATVLATVSGPAKARLAGAAGAVATVNYRTENVVERVLAVAPRGADVIVEVAAAANAAVDRGVLARHGVVACYAGTEEDRLVLPVRELLTANSGWRGVFLYTIPERALGDAVSAVSSAIAQGALGVGESSGLPVHRFPLDAVERAHDAVQRGELVGKALIDVTA
jgi:NADPH2:quinone reductase